jgi:hypothetical protein
MVKAKSNKKVKGSSKKVKGPGMVEIFPGLRFCIHYQQLTTGANRKTAPVFSFMAYDDSDAFNEDPDFTVNRSFTVDEAKKVITTLTEAMAAVETLNGQLSKLDEINCYLDSMQSTVDDFRTSLKENPVEFIDDDIDFDSDLRDLSDLVDNF